MNAEWVEPTRPSAAASPETARRATELARWRARSKTVRFYRLALPSAMAAICACLVTWIGVRAILTVFNDVGAAAIRIDNPHFYGRDDQGRAYQLTAKDAVRDVHNPDRVALNFPAMNLDAGPEKSFRSNGRTGVYFQSVRILQLKGDVKTENGRGYRFSSDTARVDLKKDLISGNSSVVSEGPLGRITASAYAVYDEGARVVFQGAVHTHLLNK